MYLIKASKQYGGYVLSVLKRALNAANRNLAAVPEVAFRWLVLLFMVLWAFSNWEIKEVVDALAYDVTDLEETVEAHSARLQYYKY